MFAWILLVLACGRKPTTFAACKDAPCKREVALRLWHDDQEGLKRELTGVTDPVEQVALVEALTATYPGETAALCEMLEAGAGKERCERINIRPHLAGKSGASAASMNTTSGVQSTSSSAVDLTTSSIVQGPGMTVLIPSDATAFANSPWENVAARAVDCDGIATDSTCRAQAAQGYASAGKADLAGATCAGMDAGQWRWECMFNAAEAASNVGGSVNARAAYELCLGTGDFMANCFAHAAMGLANAAPPSNTGDPAAWAVISEAANAIDSVLGPRDHDLSTRVIERLWSEATLTAYKRMSVVSGDPLDAVPEWVQPHVRAAAAWQLVAVDWNQDRSFAEWGKLLESSLSLRLNGGGSPVTITRGQPVKNLWFELLPGESAFSRVLYLGQARRAVGPTADDDRLICVLEAIARNAIRPAQIFLDALNHPTPEVRWTAARIIQSLDTEGIYLEQVRSSPDPVVAGRGVPMGMSMSAQGSPSGAQGGAMFPGAPGGPPPNGP